MPTNKEWLGVFNYALLELTNQYNWQQIHDTDLTIDEAIAIVQDILIDFWNTDECTDSGACLQPDGSRVLRLGVNGHIQQLTNGAWTEPTDDYAIPPVPPRPEPTPADRECLAAANAANVLKELYETVSDAIADGLDEAETIEALAVAIAAFIGAWGGLAIAALIALALAVFHVFLEVAEFMTIDFWTNEFHEKLLCVLVSCASSDGDVVTFDYDCVVEGTATAVQETDDDFLDMIRLFGQVRYLLAVIGADGLSAAGATTAIETADCSCAGWCYTIDFTEWDGDFEHIDTGTGNWVSGQGWVGVLDGLTYRVRIKREFGFDANFTQIDMVYDMVYGSGVPAGGAHLKNDGSYVASTSGLPAGTNQLTSWYGSVTADMGTIEVRSGSTGSNGSVTVKRLTYRGTGENPFGDNNCDE